MTQTLYFIEADFGRTIGISFVERPVSDMDRKSTLRDLVGGQFDKPVRVLEVIPDEGSCRDVSEDFARDIAALREPLTEGVRDFIANHAGIQLANALQAA